jgi:hypothetical protein
LQNAPRISDNFNDFVEAGGVDAGRFPGLALARLNLDIEWRAKGQRRNDEEHELEPYHCKAVSRRSLM